MLPIFPDDDSRSHSDSIATLLTVISDGDAKRAAGLLAYGPDQDDDYQLLRPRTIPFVASESNVPARIVIDRDERFQTMLGLGAAMTDSSAWLLMQLKGRDEALYEHTMRMLFSETEGAGFSAMRLPIGASDYTATTTYYTYCDTESWDLSAFSIAHDLEYVIPALKEVLRINPDISIVASPWSPPAWMKTNGSLIGITEGEKAAGAVNRLRPDCFGVYAEYLVKFVEAYRDAGIEIDAITLQNEAQCDDTRYPCMRMNEADQIALIKELGPRLRKAVLTTRIYVHDHNWILHPNDRNIVAGDRKLDPLESARQMMSDPDAGSYIAGSAWHCYSGGPEDIKRVCETLLNEFPENDLICTELSGWGKDRGDWFDGVLWGMRNNWLGSIQNGCTMSLQWNLALDEQYGPSLRTDSEGIGLVTIRSDTFDSALFEREFYAMAQISRAARPGSQRCRVSVFGEGVGGLETAAFALRDGGTSLIVFNEADEERAFQVEEGGQRFVYMLPKRSIVTFMW